jgi:YD repeat-containing protein
MKRFSALLLSLVFLTACGTDAGEPTVSSAEETMATTLVTEPDDGLLAVWHLESVSALDANGEVKYTHTYTYTYDTQGRLVKQTRETDGKPHVRWEFVRDRNGVLLEETVWYEEQQDHYGNYIYDEQGRLTDFQYYEGTDLSDEVSYTYREDGKLIEYVQYSDLYEIRDDYHERTVTYDYDEKGNCISITSTRQGENEACAYTYDNDGRILTQERWKEGALRYTLEVTYDGDRIVKRHVVRGEENRGPVETVETYAYDEEGKLIRRQAWHDGVLVEDHRYTYTQLRIEPKSEAFAAGWMQKLLERESVLFYLLELP